MNLYQLTQKQRSIDEMLEESYGEITPDIEKELDQLEQNKVAAVCQIGTLVEEYKAREEALKKIRDGYSEKIKLCETAQSRLKDYILKYLQETGQTSITHDQIKVRRQASPPSVYVKDTESVPAAFKRAIITISLATLDMIKAFGIKPEKEDYEVDKKKILQSWKDSDKVLEVNGTEIRQGEHVRIS